MITVKKAKRILGKDAVMLSDAEIESLLHTLSNLGETVVRHASQELVPNKSTGYCND